uniref:protein ALP1-like n=1 Tax=Erigeron canadensis TaxID=72917 RepID=UPI001CB8B305|nr:protein ALP1-like [Erigeron canadensis]
MDPPSPSSSDDSIDLDDAILSTVALTVTTMIQAAKDEEDQLSPRRRTVLERRRKEAYARLVRLYFAERPVFGARDFRWRYRMSKRLFLRITNDLEERYPYFQQRMDARGKLSFMLIHKTTSALRQLAYGCSVDLFDEHLEMSARTSRESLIYFCKGINELYGPTYLRRPTSMDLERIYDVHEQLHGFPGMIGSIDCMHWPWEMCATAWRGSHTRGDVGRPSLMLQTVASTDLWIWNAYFGQQGSNNDINVFEASPVLEEIIFGLAPTAGFYANNNYYKAGYYLTDGIYPEYSTFVKTFTDPIDEKRKYFKKKQESTRKDIERAFGVLKKRWKVVSFPSRFWDKQRMHDVIYACITLHNMILEDEDKAFCQDFNDEDPTLDPDVLGTTNFNGATDREFTSRTK